MVICNKFFVIYIVLDLIFVGHVIFADINECERRVHNCSINAECGNTAGSFNCTCNQGYSGDGVSCSE